MKKRNVIFLTLIFVLSGLSAKKIYHRWASRALLEAAQNHDDEAIQSLVKRGADVTLRDEDYGMTPLIWALEKRCNDKSVRALIAAGSDLNAVAKNGTGVLDSSRFCSPGVISDLVHRGAKTYWKRWDATLVIVAEKGDSETVKWLLQHGADPLSRYGDDTPFSAALRSNNVEKVRLIVEAGGYQPEGTDINTMTDLAYGRKLTMMALLAQHSGKVDGGDPGKSMEVMKTNLKIDKPRFVPPLYAAIDMKDLLVVKWLLTKGANPNRKAIFRDKPTISMPTTPLALAKKLNAGEIFALLKQYGAK